MYASLLGTLKALTELEIAAITGKDSPRGTYINENGERIDVPPTVIGFANNPIDLNNVVSAELKKSDSVVLRFPVKHCEQYGLPDFKEYKNTLNTIMELTKE